MKLSNYDRFPVHEEDEVIKCFGFYIFLVISYACMASYPVCVYYITLFASNIVLKSNDATKIIFS